VETGEPHEVHQFAVLAGYGAEAINPYLAFETLEQLLPELDEKLTYKEAQKRYIKAVDKGLLKVMSKMGISTYQSYCGAQIFDAVGLRSVFVKKYFTGTHTQVEGVGLRQIARETAERHRQAFGDVPVLEHALDVGGEYAYRIRGEAHMWRPSVVADLQHAVRGNLPDKYRSFAQQINDQSEQLMTLRGLFRLKGAEEMRRKPVPLGGGAGSRHRAALLHRRHELAHPRGPHHACYAMNLMAASRTPARVARGGPPGDHAERRSHALGHQAGGVGRFGVTAEYLMNSSMMQIGWPRAPSLARAASCPAKVDKIIAKVRHSRPAGLISPPPHHDIYSIEIRAADLDLKNVNPSADVSVKLVSEVGVGIGSGRRQGARRSCDDRGLEGGTTALAAHLHQARGRPGRSGWRDAPDAAANWLRGRIARWTMARPPGATW
jgi:glutamate synthase (NADPH/NADH) large chain